MIFTDILFRFDAQPDQGTLGRFQKCATESKQIDRVFLETFTSEKSKHLYHFESSEKWELWALGEAYRYKSSRQSQTDLWKVVLQDIANQAFQPENLVGRYLLFAFDKERHQWHAWTDRLGTIHAYYILSEQKGAIGTFYPNMLCHSSKKLDWAAISSFFKLGNFPGDRTYLEDVRIMRPSTHYQFDAHGKKVSEKRYWDWRYEPNVERSYEDTMDAFHQCFTEVLSDYMSDAKIAIPISGGLDSRSAVAASLMGNLLKDNRDHVWSYSYGYTNDSVEVEIAEEIAKIAKLPFKKYTIKPYVFDQLSLILDCVEGFQDITQTRQAYIVKDIGEHASNVLGGHMGDVWFDDFGLYQANGRLNPKPLSVDQITDIAFTKGTKSGSDWLVHQLSTPQVGKGVNEVVKSFVKSEMSLTDSIGDSAFKMKIYKTDQWSFRWTLASMRMYQPGAFPRLPFYDSRVVDFFCTLPSKHVVKRKMEIDYLKRYASSMAKVKWQAYDANLFQYQHFNGLLIPKRIIKKIWRILAQKKPIERNWETQFLGAKSRKSLEDVLIQKNRRIHEWVAPAEIRKLLDDFYQNPQETHRGYTVSMLLTFSAMMEKLKLS